MVVHMGSGFILVPDISSGMWARALPWCVRHPRFDLPDYQCLAHPGPGLGVLDPAGQNNCDRLGMCLAGVCETLIMWPGQSRHNMYVAARGLAADHRSCPTLAPALARCDAWQTSPVCNTGSIRDNLVWGRTGAGPTGADTPVCRCLIRRTWRCRARSSPR